MHACLVDAAMVLCARAGEKGPALCACFYLYYRCGMKVKCEPQITLIHVMGCDWVLVGGGCGGLVGLPCRPGPSPQPSPAEAGEGECLWRMRVLLRSWDGGLGVG